MTIIVPTDFSNVANNAARYAAQMIKGQYDATLMLYHVYEKSSEEKEATSLLEKLAAGETSETILAAYPQLRLEHIKASLEYAARIAADEIVLANQ